MTNKYFDNYYNDSEQNLIEDLINESIGIYGMEVYYLPRRSDNRDQLYETDEEQYFDTAYMVDVYLESIEGFGGDRNFMSKFGLQINDQVIFTMAKRVFEEDINRYEKYKFPRPREADLIYFPLNNKCFKILFVNDKKSFYQLGRIVMYEITCELFEYSVEVFDTGIPEIDRIQKEKSIDTLDWVIQTEDGYDIVDENDDYLVTEDYDMSEIDVFDDTEELQEEVSEFIDFTERDPFSEKGSFFNQT